MSSYYILAVFKCYQVYIFCQCVHVSIAYYRLAGKFREVQNFVFFEDRQTRKLKLGKLP